MSGSVTAERTATMQRWIPIEELPGGYVWKGDNEIPAWVRDKFLAGLSLTVQILLGIVEDPHEWTD